MYEIKVTFKNGMNLKWSAKTWDRASALHDVLVKKYRNAKSVKIWKIGD